VFWDDVAGKLRVMIYVLKQPATAEQVAQMLEVHGTFIKLGVDIQRGMLAGGGEFHADCESALIEAGSQKVDIWGADWLPKEQAVRFGALINIRPKLNRSMEIQDPAIREQVERIIRRVFQQP